MRCLHKRAMNERRVRGWRSGIGSTTSKRTFLEFVLAHYVSEGVQELDQDKLTPLLRLRYQDAIADAIMDLGRPEQINKAFTGFQKYLYERG
jgi:type I restriction enzyme, R subunit